MRVTYQRDHREWLGAPYMEGTVLGRWHNQSGEFVLVEWDRLKEPQVEWTEDLVPVKEDRC